jgi:hypothetical protein
MGDPIQKVGELTDRASALGGDDARLGVRMPILFQMAKELLEELSIPSRQKLISTRKYASYHRTKEIPLSVLSGIGIDRVALLKVMVFRPRARKARKVDPVRHYVLAVNYDPGMKTLKIVDPNQPEKDFDAQVELAKAYGGIKTFRLKSNQWRPYLDDGSAQEVLIEDLLMIELN